MKEIFYGIYREISELLPKDPLQKTAVLAITLLCLWISFNFIDCSLNYPKDLPDSVWYALGAVIIIISIWSAFYERPNNDDDDGGGGDEPQPDPPPDPTLAKDLIDSTIRSSQEKFKKGRNKKDPVPL